MNECQVLAANFYEISHFEVRVLDAGAAVGDIDEDALGRLVVLALHCPADAQHEVSRLLLDLPQEKSTSLLKVCRSSGDILAISSALSNDRR